MTPRTFIKIVFLGIALAAGAFFVKNLSFAPKKTLSPQETSSVAQVDYKKSAGPVSIGGPFLLQDQFGKMRSHVDFRGRYMLVYFGYTYCPDICPMALYALSDALEQLGEKAAKFQPLFITIDPVRDTTQVLKSYLKNFHPSFVGLTGELDSLQKAQKFYHVHASKPLDQEDKQDYILDHSSLIYVMDPRGRFMTSFNHASPPEHIVKVLLTLP